MKTHKYLPILSGIFTANLILSTVLNAKIIMIFGYAFPAGILTFPISFLFADALTEVYGYSATRKVIWTGFAIQIFAAISVWAAIRLPSAAFWSNQAAFATTLGQVPRIVVASIIAYFGGEFCNSYVLARSKIGSEGKNMWVRFVTSTMAGEAVDTLVFMTIAFLGVFPPGSMLTLFVTSWLLKVIWEIVALPVSVPVVRWLKNKENEDYFDRGTNFNPFHVSE